MPPKSAEARARPEPVAPALLDFVGQQAVWWSAVAAVRFHQESLAAIPAVVFVALVTRLRGRAVLLLAASGAAIGFAVDTALVQAGELSFPSHAGAQATTVWMVGLWAAFALAFSGSLAWLTRRGWFAALLFGAVAGVVAVRAGASLGVLRVSPSLGALPAIAAAWALAVSALRLVARRIAAGATEGAAAPRAALVPSRAACLPPKGVT